MKTISKTIFAGLLLIPSFGYCGTGSGKIMAIYSHEKVVNGVDKGVVMLSMEAS
ncbi:hypothetical protein [Xanthomonas bonasiae]|uniref:hypothetical protein n=1 Tax=Xanthomonas bonasiae TaxID=2810351 RepID=UPI00197F5090|nr:hypothetical protein [Xanthomonas bonasiae]MBN6112938.1 hypothetical protein [Xanthomonas bonasiae]